MCFNFAKCLVKSLTNLPIGQIVQKINQGPVSGSFSALSAASESALVVAVDSNVAGALAPGNYTLEVTSLGKNSVCVNENSCENLTQIDQFLGWKHHAVFFLGGMG